MKCANIKTNKAFTLTEVVITMLIISIVVGVSIKVAKTRLDNIITYNYYAAYETIKNVTEELYNDFNLNQDNYKIGFWSKIRSALKTPVFVPKSYAEDSNSDVKILYSCPKFNIPRIENTSPVSGDNVDFKESNQVDPPETLNSLEEMPSCNLSSYLNDGLKTLGFEKCSGKHSAGYGRPLFSSFRKASESCSNPCLSYNSGNNSIWSGSNCGRYIISQVFCSGDGVFFEGNGDGNIGYCKYEVKQEEDACIPTPCDEGFEFNTDACRCIVSPMTIPKHNFCKEFELRSNTKSNLIESKDKITEYCKGDSISSTETTFSNKKPDLILRNGMRIYNISQAYYEIPALVGNNPGSTFTRPSDNQVIDIDRYGYKIYVDIDGSNSEGILWYDVYPFYITLSGKVIPDYDLSHPGESGGDSKFHLMVSIRNILEEGSGSWYYKSVDFREGACSSGYLGDGSVYCSQNGTAISNDNRCLQSTSDCKLRIVRPTIFLK